MAEPLVGRKEESQTPLTSWGPVSLSPVEGIPGIGRRVLLGWVGVGHPDSGGADQ